MAASFHRIDRHSGQERNLFLLGWVLGSRKSYINYLPVFILTQLFLRGCNETTLRLPCARDGSCQPKPGRRQKVLMYSKSVAFQHDVVKRPSVDELSPAEKIVVDLGKKHGFEVTATKDGNLITADNLKKYDAVLFYTQGELDQAGGAEKGKPGEPFPPMAKENRQAILDYINNGGGFIGTHCGGADTFHNWVEGDKKPFLDMVGGEFVSHGSQQPAIIDIVDKSHPAVAHLKPRITVTDEWYAYKGF